MGDNTTSGAGNETHVTSLQAASVTSHDPTAVFSHISAPLVTPLETTTKNAPSVLGMRRSSSADDIWLKYSGRLNADFDVDDFDDGASQASVDSIAASEGDAPAAVKFSQWTTPHRALRGIVEEGDADTETRSPDPALVPCEQAPHLPANKKFQKRGLGSLEPQRCQQSLIWRWLATTATVPGAKLPQGQKPGLKMGSAEDKMCKEFSFSFKSRDLNAVAPSNF